jgi:hypothetical protein
MTATIAPQASTPVRLHGLLVLCVQLALTRKTTASIGATIALLADSLTQAVTNVVTAPLGEYPLTSVATAQIASRAHTANVSAVIRFAAIALTVELGNTHS